MSAAKPAVQLGSSDLPGPAEAWRAHAVAVGFLSPGIRLSAESAAPGAGSAYRSGAPRSKKMGNTRSPWYYDGVAGSPLQQKTATACDFRLRFPRGLCSRERDLLPENCKTRDRRLRGRLSQRSFDCLRFVLNDQ
jgi:hypothetical protein